MKKITINDIAKALSVTPSTVSRALAGNTRVSLKTRNRVKEKARELGYQPNVIAASLRKGKSDTIGLIVPRVNRHFFSNVISGVEEILNPAGYNLVICQSGENISKEKKAVETLLRNQVGGIILSLSVQTQSFAHLEEVVRRQIPLVQFDRINSDIPGYKVINDNYTGAYLATKHLLKEGYKRVAHFAGERKLKAYQERYEGYLKAMQEANCDLDEGLIFDNVITREAGHGTIQRVLDGGQADAVFCAGDYSARGALDGLKERGVQVPGDFGVVGFANEPFAELMYPSLSSVEQNAFEMGNKAAAAMIKSIEGGEVVTEEFLVPVRLIVRQSSKSE
ncbi:MAG: LacI family DNA-binding transcriptional regulator [Marinilabiliaceae bacterium]|nr:LacI family DNA-binding transcriptional regulator [Marinilabiliaceae bacterium]